MHRKVRCPPNVTPEPTSVNIYIQILSINPLLGILNIADLCAKLVYFQQINIYVNISWFRGYFWWTSSFPRHQKVSRKKYDI